MKPKSFMLIAGETSGDQLAAELVRSLRERLPGSFFSRTRDYQPLEGTFEPRFFGAGGPAMAAAGVELSIDLTAHAVVGFSEVFKNYFKFRRFFQNLFHIALERQPDAIICVDFSGFNRRFAQAVRRHVRSRRDWFHDWDPRLIQYVSPQVWASRESRAYRMAEDYDLLLSIFPFEPAWYAARVPGFKVEFVGHPLLDRYATAPRPTSAGSGSGNSPKKLVLLPGSRRAELQHHLPLMNDSLARLRKDFPHLKTVLLAPNQYLADQSRKVGLAPDVEVQVGQLPQTLAGADLALASTGTVTLECAFFGVPTVALYKTTWINYALAKHLATVKYLAMPNLLAGQEILPEFIQARATPETIAAAALDLLRDTQKRNLMRSRFAAVIAMLGEPGASRRAAESITRLFKV